MTAIDTNIFAALWDDEERVNLKAQEALDEAAASGFLIVAAPVYAELCARPGRTQAMLDGFFSKAEIQIDWRLSERVWRMAGNAFQAHCARRRASGGGQARRVVADFVIGAHAVANDCSLLTLDRGFFERNFPGLAIKSFL